VKIARDIGRALCGCVRVCYSHSYQHTSTTHTHTHARP